MNYKDKVKVSCNDCKKKFEVDYGTYRRRSENHIWRCKSCRAKNVWTSLTEDEYNQRCESQKERWEKLTPEEKSILMENTRIAQKQYASSPITRLRLAKRNRDRWKNLSKLERELEKIRLNNMRDEYWNSLTGEEKFFKMKKLWDSTIKIGPTEYKFNHDLRLHGLITGSNYQWGYSTFPYIHPEYYDKFGKVNPVTKEENFPYHVWDFIIYSKNGKNILVDIDGSAHSKDSMLFCRGDNTYTEREKIDYNDSQRPYQIPDNMIAYVIQCHDDKLEDNQIVLDLINDKKIIYKDLINTITFSQYTKKEIKELINDMF